jgi:hypothetical protein
MSTIVVMSSTVGALTSGQTYRVRSKTAEQLVRNTQATKSALKKTDNDDKAGRA